MNPFDYNRPNTRERVAARRQAARRGSSVMPGPRRVFGTWFATGWIVSAILLVGSLVALYYVMTSPRFTVQEVQVRGTSVMKPEEVQELAAVDGRSIWFVNTVQIAEQVGSSPYVEGVEVDVALPDRVEISVQERQPELRWLSGGQRYLVDASGLVLGPDTTDTLTNTLLIEDRSGLPIQPKDHVDSDALGLARVLALRLPGELQLQPSSILWDSDRGVSILLSDQRTIIFGRNEHLDDKMLILKQLLAQGTPFKLLDLRPETPYYRNDDGNGPSPTTTP